MKINIMMKHFLCLAVTLAGLNILAGCQPSLSPAPQVLDMNLKTVAVTLSFQLPPGMAFTADEFQAKTSGRANNSQDRFRHWEGGI